MSPHCHHWNLATMWQVLTAGITLSALLYVHPAAAQYSAHACLEYETVQLTGRLAPQVLAGPPDYKSVTGGDESRVIWVLLLDQPTCIADSVPSRPRIFRAREIQLLLEPDQYVLYGELLARRVTVVGELLPGGGRYDKPLVLFTREILKADVRPLPQSAERYR
ncbi:MAG TPA: hypothetical protein VIT67_21985 [Povalibacter sp.]